MLGENQKPLTLHYSLVQRLESLTTEIERLKSEAQRREELHEEEKGNLNDKISAEQKQRESAEARAIAAQKEVEDIPLSRKKRRSAPNSRNFRLLKVGEKFLPKCVKI